MTSKLAKARKNRRVRDPHLNKIKEEEKEKWDKRKEVEEISLIYI